MSNNLDRFGMKPYSWRWVPLLGVLAAFWTVFELTFGTLLHTFHVPFAGAIITVFTLPLMLFTRRLTAKFGMVTTLGIITGIVRWLLGGAFPFLVSSAIIIEALLVDLGLGFKIGTKISRFRAMLAGSLCLGYTALHPIIFFGMLVGGGKGILLPKGVTSLLAASGVWGLHFIVGGVAGYWAWAFIEKLPIAFFYQAGYAPAQPNSDLHTNDKTNCS
jgi:hypothetical protein